MLLCVGDKFCQSAAAPGGDFIALCIDLDKRMLVGDAVFLFEFCCRVIIKFQKNHILGYLVHLCAELFIQRSACGAPVGMKIEDALLVFCRIKRGLRVGKISG